MTYRTDFTTQVHTLNTAGENTHDDKHVQNATSRVTTTRSCHDGRQQRQCGPANRRSGHHWLGSTTITQVTTEHLSGRVAPEERRQNNALNTHIPMNTVITIINHHIDTGMSAGCSSLFLRLLSHWKFLSKVPFKSLLSKKNFQVQTVHLRKFIAFESYFHKASAYGSRVGRTPARRRHTSYFHSIEHVLYCESNFWK